MRYTGRLRAVAVLIAALIAAAGGLGTGLGGTGRAAPEATARMIDTRSTGTYQSIDDLRGNSSAVVIVAPVAAVTATFHGVPVTLTEVRVGSVVSGSMPDGQPVVQQFRVGSKAPPGASPPLRTDREYLLFLRPFRVRPGEHTGRFLITGDQGIYERHGARFRYVGSSPHLPATLDPDGLRQP